MSLRETAIETVENNNYFVMTKIYIGHHKETESGEDQKERKIESIKKSMSDRQLNDDDCNSRRS